MLEQPGKNWGWFFFFTDRLRLLGVPVHLLQVQPDVHNLPHLLQDADVEGATAVSLKEEKDCGCRGVDGGKERQKVNRWL